MNPQALENRPDLYLWMMEYIEAFNILSPRRPVGMDISAIPIPEILAYYEVFGAADPVDVFVRLLMTMDASFLAERKKDTK